MSIFYQEAEEPNKRSCKCIASALKDAFAKCNSFRGKLHSSSPPESEEPAADFDQEDEIFVSAIISKYMESKSKRRTSNFGMDSFYWALSPAAVERNGNGNGAEEFLSAGSGLSGCSSFDAFLTAKSCLSRSSSSCLSGIDFQDFDKRRSIIMELIDCECKGWPFGLYWKMLLLPPLPKSPTDSWLWTKSGRLVPLLNKEVSFITDEARNLA